jgi:hypothetical protein
MNNKSGSEPLPFKRLLGIINTTFLSPFISGALYAIGQIVVSLAWKRIRN